MGCCASAPKTTKEAYQAASVSQQAVRKPAWRSGGWTRQQLEAKRAEFWDTQPAYGGSPEIWAALRAACEAGDSATAAVYLEAAEVKIVSSDLTKFYDARGFFYELPKYAVSEPQDLKQ